MPTWFQLPSSVIASVSYHGTSLYIQFTSGHEYEYYNVPQHIYEELLQAPSAGQYFNAYIKDHYQYNKVY